jgi:antitoxin component YwqK of YwqJK toxin-antitoxin module
MAVIKSIFLPKILKTLMKFYFLLIFLAFTSLSSFSQTINDHTVYLDSSFNVTTAENYKYIRIIKDFYIPNKQVFPIEVYYKSGKIQMKGATTTGNVNDKIGTFVYFYENGKRKSLSNFNKGMLTGNHFKFYENGNNKEAGVYLDKEKSSERYYKLISLWDDNGTEIIVNGEGVKTEENENFSESINYKNGYKDGLSQHINKKYNYSLTETYENGRLISGEQKKSNGETFTYTELERKPLPKKGMEHFTNFIARNLKITSSPGSISGRIIIKFIVDKEGKIVDPEILKGMENKIDKEVIRVVTSYGNWIPGEQRGEKIRCQFVLPLSIR